jgi:hypothetical protein
VTPLGSLRYTDFVHRSWFARKQQITSSASTVDEIKTAIRNIKTSKSSGIYQVTGEMLKSEQAHHQNLKEKRFPEDWLDKLANLGLKTLHFKVSRIFF